ncbi:hypothetical protein DERP_003071 [Dermatophagoides pteronyssinus]|uniref:Uncharacterized protein n=1 Tax=Dermatophagoides pteronyssinus TaxID=6956 RepID=A0ABQ8JJ24_DERPT|nr:hypothetical protein DERP_003071 [Dermatophagoides pteronyssinus]
MSTYVNIAIIIVIKILILFRSITLANDNDLWFPKEFPNDKLIECGLDHEMFGLSIIDNYLFQLEKCAVIIYPPPLDKYLDKDFKKLKLENGYRYTFEEIQPDWKPNYCEMAKKAVNTPWLVLTYWTRPEYEAKHVLIYFFAVIDGTMKYQVHDFDLQNTIGKDKIKVRDNTLYILIAKGSGQEHFVIHNTAVEKRYELMGDPFTKMDHIKYDFICINKDDKKNYFISRIPWDDCSKDNVNLTHSLLKSISLSFTVNGKIIMISTKDNLVLLTDVEFLDFKMNDSITKPQYPLQVKSLNDFFFCEKYKSNILIFIIVGVIVLVIIIIAVITFIMIRKKKNKAKKPFDKMISKSKLKIDGKILGSKTTNTIGTSTTIPTAATSNTIPTSITIKTKN